MTPIDPPPGLLDKVAEAMHDAYEEAAAKSGWETNLASRKPWADVPEANKAATLASARAAWDAVAEGLGLREALIFGGRRHLVSDPLEPQP